MGNEKRLLLYLKFESYIRVYLLPLTFFIVLVFSNDTWLIPLLCILASTSAVLLKKTVDDIKFFLSGLKESEKLKLSEFTTSIIPDAMSLFINIVVLIELVIL